MTTLTCLALIIYMEGSNQSIQTQDFLAEFALEKANDNNTTVCKTIFNGHIYSWSHNGDLRKRGVSIYKKKDKIVVKNDVLEEEAYSVARTIARHAILRQQIRNHTYFNNCSVGKKGRRFKTDYAVLKSEKLCFY